MNFTTLFELILTLIYPYRPFECDYCGAKYYRKNVLKAHLLKCAPKTSSMIASMIRLDQTTSSTQNRKMREYCKQQVSKMRIEND